MSDFGDTTVESGFGVESDAGYDAGDSDRGLLGRLHEWGTELVGRLVDPLFEFSNYARGLSQPVVSATVQPALSADVTTPVTYYASSLDTPWKTF